jgi:hypothetical protein
MTMTRERRLATGALGMLAAALLVAGALPWLVPGPTAARLFGLPLLLVGLLAAVTAARLPRLRLARRSAPSPRPATCAGCACTTADTCAARAD